uniref:Uncharacterized protein n=1 Tax=Quercus lobata TaxID=97700 RepID=A0A7N2LLB7_QUELO
MPNLKLLIIHGVPFLHGPKHLSNDLRYLDWSEYPSKSLPSSFQPDELVKLLMCKRKIELLWEGIKHFDNLKSIKLNDSINLIATPEFSGVPNLEKLMLEGCINLLEVHSSITVHKKLTLLNLKGCKNLNFLLSKIEMESLEILILSGCSKIKRIPEFMRNIESSFSFMSLEDLNVAGNLKLDRQSKNFLSLNLSSLSPEKWNRLSKSLNSILVWAPDLDHLKTIDLNDCMRLHSLPQLPSSTPLVGAADWTMVIARVVPSHLCNKWMGMAVAFFFLATFFIQEKIAPWNYVFFVAILKSINMSEFRPLRRFSRPISACFGRFRPYRPYRSPADIGRYEPSRPDFGRVGADFGHVGPLRPESGSATWHDAARRGTDARSAASLPRRRVPPRRTRVRRPESRVRASLLKSCNFFFLTDCLQGACEDVSV